MVAIPAVPSPALPGERLVFVYGTLRAGGSRDMRRLVPAPRFIAQGSVRGRLHHLGDYPALVLGGPGWVQGEIYGVLPALEALLDEIEEVWPQRTGEYRPREVMVRVHPPPAQVLPPLLRCMLYEADPARVQGRPVIESGDWLQGR